MSSTPQSGSDMATIDIDPTVFERRWKILAVLCTSLMVVIVGNTALNVALPTLARELERIDLAATVDGGCLRAGVRRHAADRRNHRRPLRPQGHIAGRPHRVPCRARCSRRSVTAPRRSSSGAPSWASAPRSSCPPRSRSSPTSSRHTSGARPSPSGPASPAAVPPSARSPVASCSSTSRGARCSWSTCRSSRSHWSPATSCCRSRVTRTPRALDPIGALLSIAGLGSLVYAIIEAPDRGWASAESLMWFGIAAVLIAAFLLWELRNTAPDAQPALLPRPEVRGGRRRHHTRVLRDVRLLLPPHPVLPAGPRLRHARSRRQAAAVRRW